MVSNHPYDQQRYNAQRRNIPFLLTREEWELIWHRSGYMPQRGRGKGRYCMARFGDKGAYEVGNVHIIPFPKNSSDYVAPPAVRKARGAVHKGKPKSHLHRLKLSVGQVGRVFSEETRRKMSSAAKNRRK